MAEIPDTVAQLEPANEDRLYALYRSGLITRHICANGRLDELTYLQERGDRWPSGNTERPRIDYRRRRGIEVWEEYDSAADSRRLQDEGRERAWWPMYEGLPHDAKQLHFLELNAWEGFDISVPKSLGGGDNPLLSAGLTLATFALEAFHDVSDKTVGIADKLFDFIEQSAGDNGFLLRSRGFYCQHEHSHFHGSTDEFLGVCVGLVFYYKLCRLKNRADRLERIEGLARFVGRQLDRHGFWLLPPADDYKRSTRSPKPSYQCSWIFAYPLKKVFEFLGGDTLTREWDAAEFEAYFGTACAAVSGLVDVATRQLPGTPLEMLNPLKNLEFIWDKVNPIESFKDALDAADALKDALVAAGDAITGYTPGLLSHWWWILAEAMRHIPVDSLEFFLLTLLSGDLLPNPSPFAPLYEALEKAAVNRAASFNFHLVGLAIILAIETTEGLGAAAIAERNAVKIAAVHFVRTVMGTRDEPNSNYSSNAFLALITRFCAKDWLDTVELVGGSVIDALKMVAGWAGVPEADLLQNPLQWADDSAADLIVTPERWQHNLPIGPILYVNAVVEGKSSTNDDVQKELDRCQAQLSRETLVNLELPLDYNPDDRWGEVRTWEHKDDKHVYLRTRKYHKQTYDPGPPSQRILAEFEAMTNAGAAPRDIKMEAAGLDLLFPRMLGAHWGLFDKPRLRSDEDVVWPVLPYVGSPNHDAGKAVLRFQVPLHMMADERHYMKRMIALKERGSSAWARKKSRWSDRWWGHHWTIIWPNHAFRGLRAHNYDGAPPLGFFGVVGNASAEWYVEIAPRRALLEALSDEEWSPRSADRLTDSILRLKMRATELESAERAQDDADLRDFVMDFAGSWSLLQSMDVLESWRPSRLRSTELDRTSFMFARVRLRITGVGGLPPFEDLVGNDHIVVRSGILPFWNRYARVEDLAAGVRYVLNPHSGVIHDNTTSRRRHLSQLEGAWNVLALPIRSEEEIGRWSQAELQQAIDGVILWGDWTRADSDQPSWVPMRRDRYRVDQGIYGPSRRKQVYLEDERHIAARARDDAINSRALRLCSYCFGR